MSDKQIDADPRSHSRLYELKPVSRWFVVLFGMFCAGGAYLNGLTNPLTWFLLVMGGAFVLANILAYPHIHLKKLDD